MPTVKGRKYESKKGYYTLVNPQKYTGKMGSNNEILYRSTWEQRCFYYMDTNKHVIEWSNETLVIPYLLKTDGKVHRYYPDVFCKMQTNDGIKTYIIEIKPYSQTIPPTAPKNRSLKRKQRYEMEVATYVKNTCKWDATIEFAKKNDAEFIILTEKEIYGDKL